MCKEAECVRVVTNQNFLGAHVQEAGKKLSRLVKSPKETVEPCDWTVPHSRFLCLTPQPYNNPLGHASGGKEILTLLALCVMTSSRHLGHCKPLFGRMGNPDSVQPVHLNLIRLGITWSLQEGMSTPTAPSFREEGLCWSHNALLSLQDFMWLSCLGLRWYLTSCQVQWRGSTGRSKLAYLWSLHPRLVRAA